MKIRLFSLKLIVIAILPLILSYSTVTRADEEKILYCEYIHSPGQDGFIKNSGPIDTDSGVRYRPLAIRDPDCTDIVRDISFYPGDYNLPHSSPGGFIDPGSGGGWSDCSSCNADPTAVTLSPDFRTKFEDVATRWFGGIGSPRMEYYDLVISEATAHNMDPAFALMIWLHESGASNYAGICWGLGGGIPGDGLPDENGMYTYCERALDFGYNIDAYATHYTPGATEPEMDIFDDNFMAQMDHFMDLPAAYLTVCSGNPAWGTCPMDVFGVRFAQGGCPGDVDPITGEIKIDTYTPGIREMYEGFFGGYIQPGNMPCYPIAIP